MKVLLIRPEPPKETIGLKHVMICEPLEFEYLISNVPEYIKDKVELRIYDMILERKSFKKILLDEKPNFIVFTGYITHVDVIKSMSKFSKDILPKFVTGVGGVHAEVIPEDFDSPYIDFIYNKNSIDAFNETLIGLLVERDIEEIMANIELLPERKKSLTHPNRSSVEKYRKNYYYMFHNPCALIKTSYGCPYNCSFCFCKEITNGKYITRDIDDVLIELKSIKEEEIYIVDDDFLYDVERVSLFINGLKKNEIHKKFLVYGRADFIVENQELMKSFMEAGLQAVIVGIESQRETDLKDYRKGTSLEINESCIRVLRELNIELYATLIIPMDFTKADFKDLRKWLRTQEVRFVNLQPLTPMPGTEIFEEYLPHLIEKREDYAKWDMAHVVLKPKHMTIKKFYYEVLLSYYRIVMRPKNIKAMIEKYGFKECFKMFKGSSFVSWQYFMKIVKG